MSATRFVKVRVPATTANLGPGFDTLGIALQLYNFAEVRLSSGPGGGRITSPIEDSAREGATAMIHEAADAFFKRRKLRSASFDVFLGGDVPIARGLGSSVTVRLGVVAGLNELHGGKLSRQELLEVVTALEHHPDNAAPAIFGGFAVAGMLGQQVPMARFPVSADARFVALIPRFEVSTEKARKLVPDTFSKADAVHSLNRSSLITAAFASKNLGMLAGLLEDRIHQPYRARLIPGMFEVLEAGVGAGAIGGWLSGSGSTLMCLVERDPKPVARAMQKALPDSDVKILAADNRGVTVRAR